MLVVSRTILSSIINCITQCFFLMIRRPPSSIPSDTLYPCTTLVRSRNVYSHSAARRLPSSPAGSASLARHWPDVRERRSAHCRYATLPHLSRTPKNLRSERAAWPHWRQGASRAQTPAPQWPLYPATPARRPARFWSDPTHRESPDRSLRYGRTEKSRAGNEWISTG